MAAVTFGGGGCRGFLWLGANLVFLPRYGCGSPRLLYSWQWQMHRFEGEIIKHIALTFRCVCVFVYIKGDKNFKILFC